MRPRAFVILGLAVCTLIASSAVARGHSGHGGGEDGHVPPNTNYGFIPVGHSVLAGVQDGRYSDVWAHDGFAYVGSFQEPDCSRDGVHIADIHDPTAPVYIGQIESHPNTRVNDVKVIEIGARDVLIFTHELCGTIVAATLASDGGIEHGKPDPGGITQQGKEGISLWDVSDPHRPQPLARGFLDTEVHNTYPWTDHTTGRSYALVVDDLHLNDTWVIEITNPKKPQLLTKTGLGEWLEQGLFDLETSELFLGSFATPLLHDVWVEWNPTTERYEGLLSYWDAGFITIDLTDPADPVFIDDSDYPETDPVLSAYRDRPEGNAHAAVFGGDDNEFIFAGDEDFDSLSTAVTVAGESFAATTGSDTPAVDQSGVTGTPVYVGLACGSAPDATAGGQIAVIVRGTCTFTEKATTITEAGYIAGIVFNQDAAGRCETSVSMLVEGTVPMVFVPRSSGFAILGVAYDGSSCGDGSTDAQLPAEGFLGTAGLATISALFDGWGYMWVINNSGAPMAVSDQNPPGLDGPSPDVIVPPMGTVGYYAPEEVADPTKATDFGDLTMHNIETDLNNRNWAWISWYSAGMRAVEWREGHWHTNANDEGSYSWNIHETGRWIAGADDPAVIAFADAAGVTPERLAGSNFWGVHQIVVDGRQYILGSDRNTGLWIFSYECEDPDGPGPLYCGPSNQT